MSRYIDAENIKFHATPPAWNFREYVAIQSEVEAIPEADVEPVRHGHWMRKSYFPDGTPAFVCSLCGRAEACEEPYCNCGAKMDGKENEE